MEYGLFSRIDQFSNNKALQLQKVQALDNASNTVSSNTNNSNLKELQKEAIAREKNLSETKKVDNKTSGFKYDYVLTNLNFGFNSDSNDFYVRSVKGKAENQYPTEEMMRLKSYMMDLN